MAYRDTIEGFLLDRGNILYDGIGEFDYLRGEPHTLSKDQYRDTTDSNVLRTTIDAKNKDVQIASGTLNFQYTIGDVNTDSTLSYLHCNTRDSFTNELKAQAVSQNDSNKYHPSSSSSSSSSPNGSTYDTGLEKQAGLEILLLHEAVHSLNDWSESGILHGLCIDGLRAVSQHEDNTKSGGQHQQQPYVSVTAIDLDPNASGLELYYAIRNLEKNGIVSGQPMIVVSPVESGKTVISLGAYASEVVPNVIDEGSEDEYNQDTSSLQERQQAQSTLNSFHTGALLLTHVVKVWITVSTVDVLESSAESLRAFLLANIGVLSIYDNDDAGDKRASERLEGTANAQRVGLDGNYLQNPGAFVEAISNFVY